MKCPSCQTDNKENAKFCRKCGGIFSLTCPNCNTENNPGDNFCDQCGHALVEHQKITTINYNYPQSYTPKHLADKILTSRSSIEGERKLVTVMFADVANSTSIFENLDPEEVHEIMDGCFKILFDKTHSNEGTVNQVLGDGIMAIFGAPIANENHAQRACYAALSMKSAIEDYGNKLKADRKLDFKMRFGINSGLVMVGAIGDDLRMDYTADGDTTILANRLESIADPGSVLVSENTYRLVNAYFNFEHLGPKILKGKKETHKAYRLIDTSDIKTRFEEAISKGLVRFVGRKNSMLTLRNIWNRASEGFGQVLGIMGEPGVGKSRLLLEFKKSLPDKNVYFLEGRCHPHGDSITYLPFINILKTFFSIKQKEITSDINKIIKNMLSFENKQFSPFNISAIQQLLSLEVDDKSWNNIDPKQRKIYIFEALKSLFITMSEEKPLIILVDDLQWMDKTSEQFINYFIDFISQNPILLILAYRPEYTHPWANRSHYSKIGLGQLTRESSRKLISAVLEEGPVEPRLEELILKKSAGNPLFIEELIYNLLDINFVQKKNDHFVLIGELDDIKIPDTVHDIIAARIDNLDEAVKRTIQAASVIGQDFKYPVLQMITGKGEELKIYLDKLRMLEFIHEKDFYPELEYTFRHALIHDVAYSGLLMKKRGELHEKIGFAVQSLYADKLDDFYEILAYHFSLGNNFQNAYKYLKLSGKKADYNYSHLKAFEFYQNALKTLNMLPEKDRNNSQKLEICTLVTRPIAMLGFPKESLKILNECTKTAKEMGDQKLFSRFNNDISILHTARGSSSIAHSEKSFREAVKIEDIDTMAFLTPSLCYAYTTSCQYEKLIEIALLVARLIEKNERKSELFNTPFNIYSFVLCSCGMAKAMLGDFEEGKIISEKGLHQAINLINQKGLPQSVIRQYQMTLAFNEFHYANVFVMQGDGKTAIPHCQNSIKYSEDLKWHTILSQACTLLGYSTYLIGELDRAREFVLKGLEIQKDSKIEAMLSIHYWLLAVVLFDLGRLEEALQASEKALELSIKNNEKRYEGLSRLWIGKILGSKGKAQYIEGAQMIREGHFILNEIGSMPAMAIGHLNLGELYRNSGERIKALHEFLIARSMFEEMGMDYWTIKCKAASKGL